VRKPIAAPAPRQLFDGDYIYEVVEDSDDDVPTQPARVRDRDQILAGDSEDELYEERPPRKRQRITASPEDLDSLLERFSVSQSPMRLQRQNAIIIGSSTEEASTEDTYQEDSWCVRD
jgi:hypothetical protein